jgi:cytochrome oxidase Cu insertion factor (SCO1/SenC/PrrC family)
MKTLLAVLTRLAPLAAAVLLAGCAASSGTAASSTDANPQSAAAMGNPNLDTGTAMNGITAPDLHLVNQFGQPMSLSQFRGKVVLLSFEDSECTTVCPLTTQSMVWAKELLGAAGDNVQLLGVDANPTATSVADVMSYSRAHGMVNQWDFLTGSVPQLKAAWKAYDIAVQIEQGQIDHTPALFVIDQRGREQKLYLTQMAYSSIGQSAQVLADEVSSLLPSHPQVASNESLAAVTVQSPGAHVSRPPSAPPR